MAVKPPASRCITVTLGPCDPVSMATCPAAAFATLDGDALSDLHVVYRQQPKLVGPNHFGSRIAFDGHGHVFISQGERFAYKAYAQDLGKLQGKLVRLNLDGSIPADNPFAGRAKKR